MASVIWAEPALLDLDAIADYIALDKPDAARKLVQRYSPGLVSFKNFPTWDRSRPKFLICLTVNFIFHPAASFIE
ncbi:MAG: type II toxin-antitoxin system RelE/ParE family toxin [Candidatus Binatia bacterium]